MLSVEFVMWWMCWESAVKAVFGEAGVLDLRPGVYTEWNISVVSGTLHGHRCHFSSWWEKVSPKGSNVCVKFVTCSWGGEASCSFGQCSSAEMGLSGSPNAASQVVAKSLRSFVQQPQTTNHKPQTTNKQTNHKQTDKQTNRQTNKQTNKQQQQQQQYNLERLRFNRRGAPTPLWGAEACSPPSRRPNAIPAVPPYVVRTPHLHGALTTEETSFVKP